MITLDLTKEEAFMLRDLTIGTDLGYEWLQEIADSLEEKLGEAIKKTADEAFRVQSADFRHKNTMGK